MEKMDRECVFVVHGFLGSPLELWPMGKWLEGMGFEVRLWGHWTVTAPISEYASGLCSSIREKMERGAVGKIHLVGHSMGAIIVRAAMEQMRDNFSAPHVSKGRAVLMAPPNGGSHVASGMPDWLGRLVPAIGDLSDEDGNYVRSIPSHPPLESGVIWTKTDHLVRPSSARLAGARDERRVGGLHTTMLYSRETAVLVANFLRTGAFSSTRPVSSAPAAFGNPL